MSIQAVILAAGIGSRLRPITTKIPKCLVPVSGTNIINRILNALVQQHIKDITIVVGYHATAVKRHVTKTFPKLKIRFVLNRRYRSTNYAYSLWRARHGIHGTRVLVLHADLIFEPALIADVLALQNSGVVVQKQRVHDWGVAIKQGAIVRIAPNLAAKTGRRLFFLYVFNKKDWHIFMDSISQHIRNKNVKVNAEIPLTENLSSIVLRPIFSRHAGIEIDTPADLDKAEKWLQRRVHKT